MRTRSAVVSLAVLLCVTGGVHASGGMLGIFGILDKVIFEPDEAHAERIQLWGSFGYADCCGGLSNVERGYLYFKLPPGTATGGTRSTVTLIHNEWADLKSVAGSGQAVGFGFWSDAGAVRGLQRTGQVSTGTYVVRFAPVDTAQHELRVRPASEKPQSPAEYHTDIGVVKLNPTGNNVEIVRLLKEAQQR
jgi:hypothetical protein